MSTYIRRAREDKVSRPDHYVCIKCRNKFNDADIIKKEANDIFYAQALCPECQSSKLIIGWWLQKSSR